MWGSDAGLPPKAEVLTRRQLGIFWLCLVALNNTGIRFDSHVAGEVVLRVHSYPIRRKGDAY